MRRVANSLGALTDSESCITRHFLKFSPLFPRSVRMHTPSKSVDLVDILYSPRFVLPLRSPENCAGFWALYGLGCRYYRKVAYASRFAIAFAVAIAIHYPPHLLHLPTHLQPQHPHLNSNPHSHSHAHPLVYLAHHTIVYFERKGRR